MTHNTTLHHRRTPGFTVAQLLIILVAAALIIASVIVIYATLHKTSSTTDGLTPVSTSQQTPSQINAERTAQNKRMCQVMSPQQKAQLAKSRMPSPCTMEQ